MKVDKNYQVEYKCPHYKRKKMIKCTHQNYKISAFSKTLLEILKARGGYKNWAAHTSDKKLYPENIKDPYNSIWKRQNLNF